MSKVIPEKDLVLSGMINCTLKIETNFWIV
jgi:hypothetical protein